MTREEKYRKLDEKRPLKYGSHRESILRKERFQKKIRDLVKEIPYKEFDDLLNDFIRLSYVEYYDTDRYDVNIIVCKIDNEYYTLVKGYSYELFKKTRNIVSLKESFGFRLDDFLFLMDEMDSIRDKISSLVTMGFDLWDKYVQEEKNDEYKNSFKRDKNIGDEVTKFWKYAEKSSIDETGLNIEEVLDHLFTKRSYIIKEKKIGI